MAEHNKFFAGGGVKVRIDGYERERFFNIAAQRGLTICEISEEHESGAITFWTRIHDFKRMKPVARKAGVRLKLEGKYGLPFFLYRNRSRKLLAAGACSFFLMLYALSFFIWDISFEGNYRFSDETLLHYMETLPVVYGMRKSTLSCEWLEGEIRNHFTEITWVSAELSGTRLIVRIKENEALLAPLAVDTSPCDLTAASDGTIVRTITRSGICQVKAGDAVTAGTLLVSGTIPIYDDAETLINAHQIHSDAEIYAQTVHTYEDRLPLSRTLPARTGRTRRGFFLEVFGKTFSFLTPNLNFVPGQEENPWHFVTEEGQLKLFDDFYLPVFGGLITAYEYVPYEAAYTKEEISAFAEYKKAQYIEKLSEKGIQILTNNDKIEKTNSGWKIRTTFTVIEDIAKETPIPEAVVEMHEENE